MKKKRSFGPVFSDEVAKVNFKTAHFKHITDDGWKDFLLPNFNPNERQGLEKSFWRVTVFTALGCVCFFMIFLRLFHLQLVEGKQNRELADSNRIKIKIVHAPRGVIYDRRGKILAANSPGFRLMDFKLKKRVFISREEALEMEVKNDPRVNDLEVDNIRSYPKGKEMSQILGYVGQISPDQLKETYFKNYKSGDIIGQTGIESYYEGLLKGVDGGEIIEVDASGKKLRTIRTLTPVAGKNIYLTIDTDLQQQIVTLLSESIKKVGSCCGAAIAEDPNNGQVLVLVSLPSYDNNLFTRQNDEDEIGKIFADKDAPVLNRAIAGTYPPGSTFKILSSIAALQSGKVTVETVYNDTGEIFLGSFRFTNWFFNQYGKTEGPMDLLKALKRSNDTYFYRVAQTIGEANLIDWSKKMKFGSKLGIDLPGEEGGLVPDNAWKVKNYGTVWYPGDTLHLSIGQGFMLATPLQILTLTSFIASGGNMYKPQLLLKATSESQTVLEFKPDLLFSNLVKKEFINTIKNGLSEVTKEGGTAWPFFNFAISSAGKTGTAEFGDPKNRTHAWYTAYAPSDDPKIAMTVLIEAGGEGSSVAAPVVKETFRYFFSEDKNHLIKDIYQSASDSAKALGE